MQENNPQRSFLLSLEEPLQNSIHSGISWLSSWVPESVRSTVTHYTHSALDASADYVSNLADTLPAQNTLPLTWEAPLRDGPDYWAAHCTVRLEEIVESTAMTATTPHQDLMDLQQCVTPGALSPWVLDRGLKDLQQHYEAQGNTCLTPVIPAGKQEPSAQERETDPILPAKIITDHRAFLRDQLLRDPHYTIQLLQTDLNHAYAQWQKGGCDWKEVVDSVRDYARVLPVSTLQAVFDALGEKLKEQYGQAQLTKANYNKGKRTLTNAKRSCQKKTPYRFLGIPFEQDITVKEESTIAYTALGGLTMAFVAQTVASSMGIGFRANTDISTHPTRFSANNLVSRVTGHALGAWLARPDAGVSWLLTASALAAWPTTTWAQTASDCTTGCDAGILLGDGFTAIDAVVLKNGDLVVVGQAEDGDASGVYAQRFAANGTRVGNQMQVNTYTQDSQSFPQLLSLSDGGYLVAWQSNGQDGSGYGIYSERFAANGARVGKETQVNTYTKNDQDSPQLLSLSDGGYLVTWESDGQDGSYGGIFSQRFAADGTRVGNETQVNTYAEDGQTSPQLLSLSDGGYLVTWESDGQDGSQVGIYSQRFAADGIRVGKERQVNTYTDIDQFSPRLLSLSDGEYLVVWESYWQDGSQVGIYSQRFAADGARVGKETQVNTYTDSWQTSPQLLSLSDGEYLVAWESMYQDGSELGIYSQRFAADGARVGDETQVNTYTKGGQNSAQLLSLSDGGYGIYFSDSGSLQGWGSVFDGRGERRATLGLDAVWSVQSVMAGASLVKVLPQLDRGFWVITAHAMLLYDVRNGWVDFSPPMDPVSSEERVNTYTQDYQSSAQLLSLSDGGYLVAWESRYQDGSEHGIYSQRFAADGARVGDETQVNTYTQNSQSSSQLLSLSDEGYLVAWTSEEQDGSKLGIYSQRFAADGTRVGNETQVNTYAEDGQTSPQLLSLSDGGYLVAWQSDGQDGSKFGIYSQRFAADGRRVGTETQVNTYTEDWQYSPQLLSLSDGGYLVAWWSWEQDGSGDGIYSQRFAADGARVGQETQVNTYTKNDQSSPQLLSLSDGGYLVAWNSWEQDGSKWGIYSQRFAADGTRVGNETQVNTYTDDNQSSPQLLSLSDGGYLVAWTSEGQDGSEWGIYSQRFAADGRRVGTETQVNTYTNSAQRYPQLLSLSDGGYLVAWDSWEQDGLYYGIYSQRFAADGRRVGTETQVNTYTNSAQRYPQLLSLSDGGYLVAWLSEGQDGSEWGIYSQRFAADGRFAFYHVSYLTLPLFFEKTAIPMDSDSIVLLMGDTFIHLWQVARLKDFLPEIKPIDHEWQWFGIEANGSMNLQPAALPVTQRCAQAWQAASLSNTDLLLVWADGGCVSDNITTVYAQRIRVPEGDMHTEAPLSLWSGVDFHGELAIQHSAEKGLMIVWTQFTEAGSAFFFQACSDVAQLFSGDCQPWRYSLSTDDKGAVLFFRQPRLVAADKDTYWLTGLMNHRPWASVWNFNQTTGTWQKTPSHADWVSPAFTGVTALWQWQPVTETACVSIWQVRGASPFCDNDVLIEWCRWNAKEAPLTVDLNQAYTLTPVNEGSQHNPVVIVSSVTQAALVAWINQPQSLQQSYPSVTHRFLSLDVSPAFSIGEQYPEIMTCAVWPQSISVSALPDGGFLLTFAADFTCESSFQWVARRFNYHGESVALSQAFDFQAISTTTPGLMITEDTDFQVETLGTLRPYSPAGDVVFFLAFDPPQLAATLLNAAYDTNIQAIRLTQHASGYEGVWRVQGHPYYFNEKSAWRSLFFKPAQDYPLLIDVQNHGLSSETARMPGQLRYCLTGVADAVDCDNLGAWQLPLNVTLQEINDVPRYRAVGFSVTPKQGEAFSQDLSEVVVDVDTLPNHLTYRLACELPDPKYPCHFAYNRSLANSCEEQAQRYSGSLPDPSPPGLSHLRTDGNQLRGEALLNGTWCVGVNIDDGIGNATLHFLLSVAQADEGSSSNRTSILIGASSAAGALVLLIAAILIRRRYLADNPRTRAYKNQLIQREALHTLNDVKERAFAPAVVKLKERWGEDYLLRNYESQLQPTVYVSVADNDFEGQAWLTSFLKPNLNLLGVRVYSTLVKKQAEKTGALSANPLAAIASRATSSERSSQAAVLDDTTFVCVLGSFAYPEWYEERGEEDRVLIEQLLNDPNRSAALLTIVRPLSGTIEETLPPALQASAIYAPSNQDVDLLFALIHRLYALDAEGNHEAKEKVEELQNRFHAAEAAIEQKTRPEIEKLMRTQRGEDPAPGRSRFGFFASSRAHRDSQGEELIALPPAAKMSLEP